jgi:hypothetical protein
VNDNGGGFGRFMRFCRIVKETEIQIGFPVSDLSHPFIHHLRPRNPLVSRLIGIPKFHVAKVLLPGCLTNIAPSVVGSIAVLVVNVMLWPLAGYDCDDDSMAPVPFPSYLDDKISIFVTGSPSKFSRFPVATGRNVGSLLPMKQAGFRIIGENQSQELGGKIVSRHRNIAEFGNGSHCL